MQWMKLQVKVVMLKKNEEREKDAKKNIFSKSQVIGFLLINYTSTWWNDDDDASSSYKCGWCKSLSSFCVTHVTMIEWYIQGGGEETLLLIENNFFLYNLIIIVENLAMMGHVWERLINRFIGCVYYPFTQ